MKLVSMLGMFILLSCSGGSDGIKGKWIVEKVIENGEKVDYFQRETIYFDFQELDKLEMIVDGKDTLVGQWEIANEDSLKCKLYKSISTSMLTGKYKMKDNILHFVGNRYREGDKKKTMFDMYMKRVGK